MPTAPSPTFSIKASMIPFKSSIVFGASSPNSSIQSWRSQSICAVSISQSTYGIPYCTPSKVHACTHCSPADSIMDLSRSLAYSSKYDPISTTRSASTRFFSVNLSTQTISGIVPAATAALNFCVCCSSFGAIHRYFTLIPRRSAISLVQRLSS